jgi:hypothetical protein
MNAIALTLQHRAAAPALAEAMRYVCTGLATLIARAFLRDPRHVVIIVPLWTRLTRAARRFDRLMARIAAGTEQPRPRPATSRQGAHGTAPVRFPARRAWLLAALKHEAAHYTQWLERRLSDPVTAELIASVPQAQSILRPLCHMLGVRHASLGVDHRRKPSSPRPGKGRAIAPPALPSPLPRLREGQGEGRTAARAHPVSPERDDAPAFSPRPAPELCPRLLTRWPFAPLPTRRPA